jgi:hypothetical protein
LEPGWLLNSDPGNSGKSGIFIWMDPAAFAPYPAPHQGSAPGVFRPQQFNGGGQRQQRIQNNAGPGQNLPQGSKLATYMNRGGPGGPNFAGPNPGGPSGSSNAAQMSQMVSDLNNLGLDQNTLKQLSMKGIREFMPTTGSSGSGLRGSPHDNSGSSSPFPQNYGSTGGSQQRLQPPAASMSSYGSPRASPTPSSGSVSSMMTAQQTQDMNNAAAAQGGDPASISTYSDGGTTYFYAGDEMVRF